MSFGQSFTHPLILLACLSGTSSAWAGTENSLDVGRGAFSVIPEGAGLPAGANMACNQGPVIAEGIRGTVASRPGETRKFDRVQLADSGRVPPAGEVNTEKQVEKASMASPKTEIFRIGEAKAISTLAAGGFADAPTLEDHGTMQTSTPSAQTTNSF